MTNSIINTNNKRISEIDDFFGKIQSAFISAADIVLKTIFVIKINWKKCKQQKWYNTIFQKMRRSLN